MAFSSPPPSTSADSAALLQASSLLDLIGRTPLVRLTKVVPSGAAEVWVKCEHFNPGGSVKDRIALAMIEAAEAEGAITPGRSVIVEPTSGNTGIGLALVCAAKGYRLILCMPESMSLERRALLQSYGAEIILTPEDQVMEGAVSRAREICRDNADAYLPDQFANPANAKAHYRTTGPEVVEQLGTDTVDAFVSAIGTGGTVTGVGRCLREHYPKCAILGIEPERSAVISGKPAGPHKIQGIGAGFVPEILDRQLIDEVRLIDDRDAYVMSKRLAREEGLLVGISSGANVAVAVDVARDLGPSGRVVTILCDTGERYFSLDEYFER